MFKSIYKFFGLNESILFTIGNSLVGILGSLLTSFFIIKYFTINEQGYYYTFGSLVALQVFFELGLGGVIIQYVAHEFSFLTINEDGIIGGPIKYKSRLSSLFRFCFKWYIFLSVILLSTLIILGYLFFHKFENVGGDHEISWFVPWILLVLGTSFNLFLSPFVAFLQGLGKIKEIAKIQVFVQLLRLLIILLGIYFGAKLNVLGLSSILCAGLLVLLIYVKFKAIFRQLINFSVSEKISYLNEILPFQWRIGLSWISGYFVSQIFNPILFATDGPSAAGQMGLTLSALNAILSISMAWITTRIPTFSSLIAQKKFNELDSIFNKALIQSTVLNILMVIAFVSLLSFCQNTGLVFHSILISSRFLNFWPLIFISATIGINHVVGSWAFYLRCHKKEPYLIFSLVTGLSCLLSTLFFSSRLGVLGLSIGYLIVVIIMFPWAYIIFKQKKREWHL